ncbi:MAG: hypothetical protein FJ398_09470 [Verrucomicrobia bacterium]|nr:hypothetical protein [Verrucomicrobiota bacterium]
MQIEVMSVLKVKTKALRGKTRSGRRLSGRQLASILQRMDTAETPHERKRLRREFMRGFYGDGRADRHA